MRSPQQILFRAAVLCAAVVWSFPSLAAEPSRNLAVSQPADGAYATEQRLALVIGNSSYQSAPLKNPANDAADIAKTLRGFGFQVTLKQNQGREAMAQAIREFGNQLKRGGTGLFYYAGHGMQVKGRNYLIPVDADIQSEDEVPYRSIDVNEVLAKMESARNRINLVILDACRNNPFARSFRSSAQGLAQMEAPVGTLIAFATAPGSVAADGQGRNGLYTQHLLSAINQPGLKIEDVFKRVRAGVRKDSGNRQVPWENTSLEGDFYFQPPGLAAPAESSANVALFAPATGNAHQAAEPPTNVASIAPALVPERARGTVSLMAPDIAENGAVVPIGVSFSPALGAGDSAEISFALPTGQLAVTSITVQEGALDKWSLRVSMPRSGRVVVRTNRGASAERDVNVRLGGVANSGQAPLDPSAAKARYANDEARVLLEGVHGSGQLVFQGAGFSAAVTGSPYLARNPYFAFKGSIAGEVAVRQRL